MPDDVGAGTEATTTLIVRNALAREGLRRILGDGGYPVARAGAHASELRGCSWASDHIVILDSGAFDAADLDWILGVPEYAEIPRVIVIADRFDLHLMIRIFAAGARGYLVNEESHQALLIKLALVVMGEKVMPSMLVDRLRDLPACPRARGPDPLGGCALADRGRGAMSRCLSCPARWPARN